MKLGLRILAWVLFAAIVVMTLGPIGLRPESGLPVNFERLAAFVVLGACFLFAYPNHWVIVLVCLIAAAGALEWAQNLVPGRHGRMADFMFKAAGIVASICLIRVSWFTISRM